jgi:CRISPR system Cascade subunit CasA
MNGGFSNRCFMGLTTQGGMGTHVMRDIQMLLDNYDGLAKLHEPTFGKNSSEGTSLVWLVPWDGTGSLPMHSLHPLYIEICRRIRFSADDLSGIKVVAAGSKKERIDAKALDGNTGDPWAPLVVDKKGKIKSLTVTSSGFDYRMVCRLMFDREGGYLPSMLSRPANTEKNTDIVFSALVRGQGKTEGLRQRRLPISLAARNMMARSDESSMGKIAARRLQVIADIQKHLRRCIALQNASAPSLEGGKLDFNALSDSDRERALVFSEAYDKYIDAIFFEDLWNFASLPAEKANDAENQWRHKITRRAEAFLDEAAGAMPKRGHLHYGTRAKVKSYFIAVALRNEWLIKKNAVNQVA